MRPPLVFPVVVLIAAALVIAVYDVWLLCEGGVNATISWHLRRTASDNPIFAVLFGMAAGILIGHLFWPLD